jgi:hypothetical protein
MTGQFQPRLPQYRDVGKTTLQFGMREILWGLDVFRPVWGHDRAFGAILDDQPRRVVAMLMVLINIVIVIVVGAILFYLIDKYVRDGRLGNLLKILVALICLAAILQRLLPMLGVGGL